MKLIIDIDESLLNEAKNGHICLGEFADAVMNGVSYEERPQGDLKSSEALKAYAREVLCGNNPTNSLLIRMFDEIIDKAPSDYSSNCCPNCGASMKCGNKE